MRKYLLLFAVVVLSGCASTSDKDFKKYTDGLVGQSKESVIRNMGIPTKECKISDKLHLLHYDYSTTNSMMVNMSNRNHAWALFFDTFYNGGHTVKYMQLYIDENNQVAEVKHKNMN